MKGLAFLFFMFFSFEGEGHPLDLGILNITPNESGAALELDLSKSVATSLGVTEEFLKQGTVRVDLVPCVWQSDGKVTETEKTFRISSSVKCEKTSGDFELTLPFMKRSDLISTFHLLAKLNHEGEEELVNLEYGQDVLKFDLRSIRGWLGFIESGIAHIGALPSEWKGDGGIQLPDGIDHILFLLALILTGGGFLNLLKTATGFTVGHSVTLVLGSLGLVQLPSRFVESVIALSIAYVAIEVLVRKNVTSRWKVATGFGLIHGFGFASILSEFNLTGWTLVKALVAFNVGVELGQVIILCFLVPLLMLLQRSPSTYLWFTRVSSIGIAILALVWFFQRAL